MRIPLKMISHNRLFYQGSCCLFTMSYHFPSIKAALFASNLLLDKLTRIFIHQYPAPDTLSALAASST